MLPTITEVKKEFRYDIAFCRILAIAVVVIFHCFQKLQLAGNSEKQLSVFGDTFRFVDFSIISDFGLPLLVMIAGFLWGKKLEYNPDTTFTRHVISKFKRILIPYFIFQVVYLFTVGNFNISAIFYGKSGHLWFLKAIFWVFIVAYPWKWVKSKAIRLSIFLCLAAMTFLPYNLPRIFGIGMLKEYLPIFVFGLLISQYESELKAAFAKWKILLIIVGYQLLWQIVIPKAYFDGTIHLNLWMIGILRLVSKYSILAGVWYIATLIPWHRMKESLLNQIAIINDECMGIYLLHLWFVVGAVHPKVRWIFGGDEILTASPWITAILFTVLVFIISHSLTRLSRKNQLGRAIL